MRAPRWRTIGSAACVARELPRSWKHRHERHCRVRGEQAVRLRGRQIWPPRRPSLGAQGDDRILLHGAPGRQRDRQRRDHDQRRRPGGDGQGITRAHAVKQVGEERAGDDARDAGGDAQRSAPIATTLPNAPPLGQKWRASVSFTMAARCPVAVSRSSNSRPSMTLTPSALKIEQIIPALLRSGPVKGKIEAAPYILLFVGPSFRLVRGAINARHVAVLQGLELFSSQRVRQTSFSQTRGTTRLVAAAPSLPQPRHYLGWAPADPPQKAESARTNGASGAQGCHDSSPKILSQAQISGFSVRLPRRLTIHNRRDPARLLHSSAPSRTR